MSWHVNQKPKNINVDTTITRSWTVSHDACVLLVGLFISGGVLVVGGIFLGRWMVLSNLNILN